MPAVSFSRWFQCSGEVKSVNTTAWSTLGKTRDYPSLSLIAPDTVFLISSGSVDQFPKCWLPNSFKSVLIKWAQKKEQYPMEWPVKPYTAPALNEYLKDWKCKNLGFHHSPIWLWKLSSNSGSYNTRWQSFLSLTYRFRHCCGSLVSPPTFMSKPTHQMRPLGGDRAGGILLCDCIIAHEEGLWKGFICFLLFCCVRTLFFHGGMQH